MDGNTCDGEGGWIRVAQLNMSEPAVLPDLHYRTIIILIIVCVVDHHQVVLQPSSPLMDRRTLRCVERLEDTNLEQ